MRYRCVAAILWLSVALAGCSQKAMESYTPKDNEEALIVATLMRIPNGIKAKSVETVMQAYDDDLYVGNFNKYMGVATDPSALRIGKRELRQAYAQVFRGVKEMSLTITDFRLVVQGDRAVAEGYTELLVKVEAGRRESRENLIKNEVTWRIKRGPMGWRVYEEIYH